MARPDLNNVPEYFHKYIALVKESNLTDALKNQARKFIKLLLKVNKKDRDYRYAEGKWSIKEMVQHVIDTERVFAYRALSIVRNDKALLPSMDQDEYAKNCDVSNRKWKDLINEFIAVRLSTIFLFDSIDKNQVQNIGIVADYTVSVNGLGYIISGHARHHHIQIKKIIKKRNKKRKKYS